MKKRKIIITASIIISLIIVIIYSNKNDNVTFKSNGVTYALIVDGVKQNSFPSKGLYQVNVDCKNASGKWDYNAWKLYIEKATGNVSCDISFTKITSKTYLNNYIKGLSVTTQGVGQVVNEPSTDYRYEGKNPNNWIWFNNELWRIIGVFDTNTHNQSDNTSTTQKENLLVKIIRANSIGVLAKDTANTNDWANSSLYKLLNPVSGDSNSGIYYNKKNGNDNSYCYLYSNVPGKCDYTNIGIDTSYRNMVKQVTWKLGGYTTSEATTATLYTAERGSARYDSSYAYEVTGYIGLMYPSDYGYSVIESTDCPRAGEKAYLSSYNRSACAGQSWLAGQGFEWTLSPISSINIVGFMVDYYGGNVNGNVAVNGGSIRPVLYLDSSVYVIDGTGSESDPYIIGM